VRATGYPTFHSERRELAAETTWDLGTIRLVRGGNAVVAQTEGNTDGVYWSVTDRSATRWLWGAAARTEPVRSDPLPPGECLLFVTGKGIAAQAMPFTVRAGDETSVEVRAQPGILQRVEIALPAEVDLSSGVDLRVLTGVDPVQWTRVAARTGEFATAELWLAPGRYTLTARAGAWQGSAQCTIGSEESAPLRITLQ
jgi:hypothetical protein